MSRPKVIIADEDVNYIAPLQFKFAKDFFDKIDLEIITEKEYFHEFFSKPQNAEILIVSDALYDSSLQKHNITNIFVMMEQYEEGDTGDLNVNKMFKYTSIKEIFNEIVGKSVGALKIGAVTKKETQIILVTSAAGGVGKTTVSMGVAASLTQNYKKVLYINAARLQNFQYLLKNNTVLTSPELYTKLLDPTDLIYSDIKHVIRKEFFSYLPAFKAALMSVGISFSVYRKIALAAKKSADYDFIVIDVENTFDEEAARLIDIADKVIVVTDQTYNGVYATNCFVSNLNGVHSEKYVFVCNKFDRDAYNALISPEVVMKFTVNEYVENFVFNGVLRCERLMQNNGIRKVSFLVV